VNFVLTAGHGVFSLSEPGWDYPDRAFLSTNITHRKSSCLGSPDVRHLYVEVEGLSRQRVVEVDHDSLLFDFVDAHGDGDGFPLGAFRCQHRSYFLRLRRELISGNFLEGPCRTTFGALQRTGYCWVLMLSAGALELLLGIRPFINKRHPAAFVGDSLMCLLYRWLIFL